MGSAADQTLEIVRQAGVLRPKDLDAHQIPRVYLQRLVEQGAIEKLGRGLYAVAGASANEHQTLVEAARRVEHGVICLLSALRFHQLGTQAPHEVWIAIDGKAHQPKPDGLPLHVIRMSGPALTAGIEHHNIAGVPVRVFSAAKTVADCFKFRNKIGLEVTLEALREYRQAHRGRLDDVMRYAQICRVANVMRPYLEALT